MNRDEFTQSVEKSEKCPSSLPHPLQALWHIKKGDWDTAHKIVQDASDAESAWVHAHLHRHEGDLINARHWYRRAGKPEFQGGLEQEWEQISSDLLMKVR